MEDNGYPAVNSERTIFMKRAKDDFIIHGLFVDDIKLVPTDKALLMTSSCGNTRRNSKSRVESSWRSLLDYP